MADSIESLRYILGYVGQPGIVLTALIGVAIGMLLGTIPGLSGVIGVALLVPYTYYMDPATAVAFLTSMFVGGMYGGASTAILFNMPGDSDSAILTLEGYEMTKKGRAREALGLAVISAGVGGFLGTVALIVGSPLLVRVATHLGPVDYFAIALLGLALVSGFGTDSSRKAMVSGLLGVFVGTIGIAPVVGTLRFTFGQTWLMSGVDFVPAMLGAFVVSEVIVRYDSSGDAPARRCASSRVSLLEAIVMYPKYLWVVLRSAAAGIFVGVLPGAGATVASIVGYSLESRLGRRRLRGDGDPRGVVAPQIASSTASVSTLIPLLALGIPGGAVAAMLLAVFQIHGLQPGPLLFSTQPVLLNSLFAALLIGNVFIVALGLLESRHVVHLLRIPEGAFLPMVVVLAVVGAFAASNRLSDVLVMLVFGIACYWLKRGGYSIPALIFGLILGPIMEPQLLRALVIYGHNPLMFFTRPVGGPVLIASVIIVVLSLIDWNDAKDETLQVH